MSRKIILIISVLFVFGLSSMSCKTLSGGLSDSALKFAATVEVQSGQEEPSNGEQPTLPADNDQSGEQNSPSTEDEQAEEPASPEDSGSPAVQTDFPIPDGAQNLMNLGGIVNFQVKMTLKDAISYYQESLGKKGLAEDKTYYVTTEKTFNMAFKGSPNGQAVVVQGVDLGDGTVNISIRYEKL